MSSSQLECSITSQQPRTRLDEDYVPARGNSLRVIAAAEADRDQTGTPVAAVPATFEAAVPQPAGTVAITRRLNRAAMPQLRRSRRASAPSSCSSIWLQSKATPLRCYRHKC